MAINKPIKSNQVWTSQENEKLAEIIIDLVSRGVKFREAYALAGEQLGRTQYAVEKQWRVVKQKYVSKIVKNSTKFSQNKQSKDEKQLELTLNSTSKTTPSAFKEEKITNLNYDGIESGSIEEAEKIAIIAGVQGVPKIEGIEINSFTDVLSFLQGLNSEKSKIVEIKQQPNLQPQLPLQKAYDGREKAIPKTGTTKLATLRKSIESFESENFKILDSGKDGYEYIVINHEEDKGYLVKVDGEKVVGCNCPHHQYRQIDGQGVVCKHMLKVAFDKNLEVF